MNGLDEKNLGESWGETRGLQGNFGAILPQSLCLYGPNTNIVHGGSIIYNTECQVHYLIQCIALMAEKEASELEISARSMTSTTKFKI